MTATWIIALVIGTCVVGVFSLLERIIIPWRVKRTVDRIVADVKAGRTSKRTDYEDEVNFDATGFQWRSLKDTKVAPVQFAWVDVRRVIAFKIDMFTYDEIRLRFLKSEDNGFEISEAAKGWSELTEALPLFLPGCKPLADWIWTVTNPAFARNETPIFCRNTLSNFPAK